MINSPVKLSDFFLAGINYRKTDAAMRSKFAVTEEKYTDILAAAASHGVGECFIISTCNRTEIYGVAKESKSLISLLCSQTEVTAEDFSEMAYLKTSNDAIRHLFDVGAGLDSQILGDYEIVGQLKKAVKIARKAGSLGVFMDRMTNMVFQCSKQIKTNTSLSGGTVSVSFAAVQYLKENVEHIQSRNILLVGTGKFGRNTCKNLVDYLDTKNITLVNRTESKAIELASDLGLKSAPITRLPELVDQSDIIIVATNSPDPIIWRAELEKSAPKIIIDLSIPHNVETEVAQLPQIVLINVDELSMLADKTLAARKAEVPKANAIILNYITEFTEWHMMRKYVPVLMAVKSKLKEIHNSTLHISSPGESKNLNADARIQLVINGLVSKLKQRNEQGCQYIEAINEFIATRTN